MTGTMYDRGARAARGTVRCVGALALAVVPRATITGLVHIHLVATVLGAAPQSPRVPQHDSFYVDSRVLHERRLINVHTPRGYGDHRASYQVLYMPDGGVDEDFPHVVRAVDSLTAAGLIPPTIVVGIPNTERRRDLTGPTRVATDRTIAPHVGGSPAFRTFLREEVIPAVDRRYRTTSTRAIIGESLAGLFIVETFLREPAMFTRYAALDPSLWWNAGALVDSTAALVSSRRRPAHARRLFVASSRDDIDNETTRFVVALRGDAPSWLTLRFEAHPEVTHSTIFRALEHTALLDVLRNP